MERKKKMMKMACGTGPIIDPNKKMKVIIGRGV